MQATEAVTDQLLAIAGKSKGWLKLLGVLSIISGILTAITIVGILFAWLPIWMGVLQFQAGSRADSAALTKDSSQLVPLMDKRRVFYDSGSSNTHYASGVGYRFYNHWRGAVFDFSGVGEGVEEVLAY